MDGNFLDFRLWKPANDVCFKVMNRRNFLRNISAAGLTLALPSTLLRAAPDKIGRVLPKRALGKTGELVTILGLGGFHIGWTTEELARATIEAALEAGVRFFDTAESYGPGTSEDRYGAYLTPRYRDEIFLMTKSTGETAAIAQAHLEDSLRRLKTDRIDLWQIHALKSPEDVENRLTAGVLDMALKAQEKGLIRHLGFTGHSSPYAHLRMMELAGAAFAACQFPVNPVDALSQHSFLKLVVPKAEKAGYGMLAMKTLADGRFFAEKQVNAKVTWTTVDPIVPNHLSLEDCVYFALSQPVTVMIAGAEKPEYLKDKVALIEKFRKLTSAELIALANRLQSFAEAGDVEYYKSKDLPG